MAAPDWSTLTPAQATLLLSGSPAVQIDAGCELLNTDLTVAQDLSTYLDTTTGDVSWAGKARKIHRDCSITLATELNWGVSLVRNFQVLTDLASGVTARRNLGVFCLTAPDEPLGDYVTTDTGTLSPSYTVTGQDRLYLLDRQVGKSYVVAAGANVLSAVSAVFTAAGLSGVLIDSTASAAVTPDAMVWPLIPASGAPVVTLADGTTVSNSGPSTWLDIVNDLLALIAYRGVWCDETGAYRCTPYVDPALRPPISVFDADAQLSTVAVARTVTRDLWAAPNKWLFVQSNLAPTVTPVAGAGLYTVTNQSDGPSSINARNGLVWPVQYAITAVDQTSLQAQGDAQVATDKRVLTTLKVSTAPFPIAGHFDVFTYNDSRLPGGTAKVMATSWQIPLNGGDVAWVFEQVS